jgi:hypothetical protein
VSARQKRSKIRAALPGLEKLARRDAVFGFPRVEARLHEIVDDDISNDRLIVDD